MAVARLFLESLEIVHVTIPRGHLSIPGKVEFVEQLNAFRGNASLLAVLQQLVLFAV